jgi:hypothetical protein
MYSKTFSKNAPTKCASTLHRPPESHHLNCFEQWATSTTVCSALNAKSQDNPKGELIFAKEFGIKWRDLKEQVVWRGTDFGYLGVSDLYFVVHLLCVS